MKLSSLQKFILLEIYTNRQRKVPRSIIKRFYNSGEKRPKPEAIHNIITKSLERLIDRELMTGYGRRTPHKWFINEITLTDLGRRIAKSLLGRQQKLPLTIKKRRKI